MLTGNLLIKYKVTRKQILLKINNIYLKKWYELGKDMSGAAARTGKLR